MSVLRRKAHMKKEPESLWKRKRRRKVSLKYENRNGNLQNENGNGNFYAKTKAKMKWCFPVETELSVFVNMEFPFLL